jgi:ABC-type amino acid transport substrate-binding protein
MSPRKALLALALALPTVGAWAAGPPLRVCALSHNLPYTDEATGGGFDLDVARAVAEKLARPLEVVWSDNGEGLHEIDESDFPLHKLARGACDVLLSIPGPARDSLKDVPGLVLGNAYYGAGFELIGPAELSPRLKDLQEKPVAIQAQTVASFALVMLHGRQHTCFSPAEALASVGRGDAAAALVWGPTAGFELARNPIEGLAIAPGYTPPAALAWNLHAATRERDEALRTAVDGALASLVADGQLVRLAKPWGIPLHAPFAATYSLTEINKLR